MKIFYICMMIVGYIAIGAIIQLICIAWLPNSAKNMAEADEKLAEGNKALLLKYEIEFVLITTVQWPKLVIGIAEAFWYRRKLKRQLKRINKMIDKINEINKIIEEQKEETK